MKLILLTLLATLVASLPIQGESPNLLTLDDPAATLDQRDIDAAAPAATLPFENIGQNLLDISLIHERALAAATDDSSSLNGLENLLQVSVADDPVVVVVESRGNGGSDNLLDLTLGGNESLAGKSVNLLADVSEVAERDDAATAVNLNANLLDLTIRDVVSDE
ncbi:hypothetical protein BDR26DRAFT_857562 [Obelidium mucronatum]|nr:hypothetical protein BDR26DRAFT_857562 [Obelidium mucronatum]